MKQDFHELILAEGDKEAHRRFHRQGSKEEQQRQDDFLAGFRDGAMWLRDQLKQKLTTQPGDMETIRAYIERANTYGMSLEVLCWGFYEMRAQSDLTIAQALEYACQEWHAKNGMPRMACQEWHAKNGMSKLHRYYGTTNKKQTRRT